MIESVAYTDTIRVFLGISHPPRCRQRSGVSLGGGKYILGLMWHTGINSALKFVIILFGGV